MQYIAIIRIIHYEYVVEQIQEAIIDGQLKVGDRLPAERDLKEMLQTSRSTLREALRVLAAQAIRDVSHLFRTSHLEQLRTILDDPEASDNDRGVALAMLRNAAIEAGIPVVCVDADVPASNGVIHVIDTVLMPGM